MTAALRTADGERLVTRLLARPGPTCVVLAHGFSGSHAESGAPPELLDRLGARLAA